MASALKNLTSLILITLTAPLLVASTASAANAQPTIGTIPDQTVIEDQPTDACQLLPSDVETSATNLQLSGATSNPAWLSLRCAAAEHDCIDPQEPTLTF
jgi:hypothetical protein